MSDLLRHMRRANNDEATKTIVYEGASVNQLAAMFGLSNTEVAKRIRTLSPSGVRSGYPVYKVGEAAEYLVRPKVDVTAYIREMGVKDFPPALQKDLWSALNGQLKFEREQNRVFQVERVHEAWSVWHQTIRMTLLLAPDNAMREGKMPEALYVWFREYIDNLLLTLRDAVTTAMRDMPVLEPGIVDYEEGQEDDPALGHEDSPATPEADDDEPL